MVQRIKGIFFCVLESDKLFYLDKVIQPLNPVVPVPVVVSMPNETQMIDNE